MTNALASDDGRRPPEAWVWVGGSLVVLVTAVMVAKFLHHDYKDAEVWYDAGRRALEGRSLAGLPHYRYPPTFAVLVAPLAALGFPAFFFVWYAINVGLLGVSVWLTQQLTLEAHPPQASRLRNSLVLPVVLVAVYAIDTLFLGQTNILIMALVYWAFLEDLRGRQWRAGAPLGAAIAIKVFPLPLLAYFAFRRRWSVVAAGVLCSLFFLLVLPAPVRGFQRNADEVRDWADRVALPFVAHGRAGDWGQHSVDLGNQSLPALARRLLTRVDAQVATRHAPGIYANFANLPERTVNAIVLGVSILLALGLAWACGWRAPRDEVQRVTEYGLMTTLLLLTSALSWTYFFVMLLLPAAVAVRLAGERDRIGGTAALALRIALVGTAVGTALLASHYARALGCLFWASLLLYAGLALAAFELRRQKAEEATPGRA